jgi:hypothetical protein
MHEPNVVFWQTLFGTGQDKELIKRVAKYLKNVPPQSLLYAIDYGNADITEMLISENYVDVFDAIETIEPKEFNSKKLAMILKELKTLGKQYYQRK